MDAAKILIVDDEPDLCGLISLLLSKRGYNVFTASNGRAAVEEIRRSPDYDLIIMDILMPELSGIDACAELRAHSAVPVLFLSAKSQETDKEDAFFSGGDDYLTKPFSPAELIRRVEALLRRYRVYQGKSASVSIAGSLRVDFDARKAFRGNEEIPLTEKEFDLLSYLVRNPGKTLDNQTLYEQVWQEPYLPSSTNTVTVHILKLRKKLEEDPSHPTILRTVWGEGYRFDL